MANIYLERREDALKRLKTADHMLNVMYSSINEPKILLATVENIFLGLSSSIAALLYYELSLRRVPAFQDTFDAKYNLFKTRTGLKYGFDKSYFLLIEKVKDIVKRHNQSPVEFSRKSKFMICDSDYGIEELTKEKVNQYLDKSIDFYKIVHKIIDDDENIFGKRKLMKK